MTEPQHGEIRDDAVLDNLALLNRRVRANAAQLDRLEILILAVAISVTAHYLRGAVK